MDIQKQAGNPCWGQEINKRHNPGMDCMNVKGPWKFLHGVKHSVWDRTKLKTGLRKKQRKELRSSRKAKSLRRGLKEQIPFGQPKGQVTETEICDAFKKTEKEKVCESRNMAFFVRSW